VYCLWFTSGGVRRGLVECKSSPPSPSEVSQIVGLAKQLRAKRAWLVTTRPVDDRTASWAADGQVDVRVVGQKYRSPDRLTPGGRAVMRTLRGFAHLERLGRSAKEHGRGASVSALRKVLHLVTGSMLDFDLIQRAKLLYETHRENHVLAERCAYEERLAGSLPGARTASALKAYKAKALWNAMVLNAGTYTQSALMGQMLNRVYTLITLAECAEEVAAGSVAKSDVVVPRWSPIARWLSDGDLRRLLGSVLYHFVFVLGCFIPLEFKDAVYEDIGSSTGCPVDRIDDVFSLANSVFRCMARSREGSVDFILDLPIAEDKPFRWKTMILVPYFLKGVGVGYYDEKLGLQLEHDYPQRWRQAAERAEAQCYKEEQPGTQ